MRVLLSAFLLSVSAPAFADNIAGCEVVLMDFVLPLISSRAYMTTT